MTKPSMLDRTFLRFFSWRGVVSKVDQVSKTVAIVHREKDQGTCTPKTLSAGDVQYHPLSAEETLALRDALTRVIED